LPEAAPPARRILVINVCRIGDTLLATPAIRALAAAYPEAEITVLGHPKRIEVLEHLPFIAHPAGISKLSAPLRARLGGPRWDLALVYGFDAPLLEYALRAARRVVAFRQDSEALNRRLHRAVERPAFQAAHSVHLALRLTDALGIAHAGYRLAYRVTEAEAAWAQQRFIALAREIRQRRPGCEFLVFGGAEDRERASELARALGSGCTVLAGTLSLRETAALMSRTQLYIGVDTGPTHLMSCFDIPLIALYHCYSPSRLIGALEHPRYWPIDHPRPYPCSIETPMSEIGVETVLAAVERALP
jgi:heptosyltransferase-3